MGIVEKGCCASKSCISDIESLRLSELLSERCLLDVLEWDKWINSVQCTLHVLTLREAHVLTTSFSCFVHIFFHLLHRDAFIASIYV